MATVLAIGGNRTLNITCGDEKQQARFDQLMERLQRDVDTMAAIEQAGDLKEVYQALKKYCSLQFDEFEQLCKAVMEKMKTDVSKQAAERELDDAELDMVVGGNWWRTFWNVAIVVAIAAAGAVMGGFLAAGALAGACITGLAFGLGVAGGAVGGGVLMGIGAAAMSGGLRGMGLTK